MRVVRRGRRAHGGAPDAAARARAVARPRARLHRHASVEPLAGPAHHRHAALPAKRRDPRLRRLAQQLVRAARARRHPRRRSRGRGLQPAAQLPARAARPLGELSVRGRREHATALRAHRDLHAHVSALRRARPLRRLERLRAVRPLPLRHGLDRRAHADLVERATASRVSRPSRSASATRSPTWPRRSRSRRSSTRWPRGSRARTTRASRSSSCRTG